VTLLVEDGPLPGERSSCFVVVFDITVMPSSSVELSIEGIAKGTQLIPGPNPGAVSLQSKWRMDRLEAP
jgi:hypothetical protein